MSNFTRDLVSHPLILDVAEMKVGLGLAVVAEELVVRVRRSVWVGFEVLQYVIPPLQCKFFEPGFRGFAIVGSC